MVPGVGSRIVRRAWVGGGVDPTCGNLRAWLVRLGRLGVRLLGMETDGDQFQGLVRRRFPIRSADGVDGGLAEEWMSTGYGGGLDGAVGRDDCFYLYSPGDVHGARQVGIVRGDLGHHLSLALGGGLLSG